MLVQPVRGTRDILLREYASYQYLYQKALRIFPLYGYQGIETPIIEQAALFKRSLGEATDIVGKEMYVFPDRNGELLTLRPEGTAPIVRAIINNGLTQTLPQKLFYLGPMFRYERPQKGRYRQFYQVGAECIGLPQPSADVESIAMAAHFLRACQLNNYTLNINTLGDLESRQKYREALVSYFERYEGELSEDSKLRLQKNPLRILDSKDVNDQRICEQAPLFNNFLTAPSEKHFEEVQKNLQFLEIAFITNNKLVRGLDYYCHTVFEFKTTELGAQDALLGGGRYDGLFQQLGGPSLPAMGWAAGLDRLMLLCNKLQEKNTLKVAVIFIDEDCKLIAFKIMHNLRNQGISCEMPLNGNTAKRLKQAVKANCQIAVILGQEEQQNQTVKVRPLYLNNMDDSNIYNGNNQQDNTMTEDTISVHQLESYLLSFQHSIKANNI